MVDLPVGALEGPDIDVTVRFTAERETVSGISCIPILALENGATLTLGDVVEVDEAFEPAYDRIFVDGTPAILIDVAKALDADALRVLDAVTDLVAEETVRLPASLKVEVVQDVTSIIRDRLVMLVQNGVIKSRQAEGKSMTLAAGEAVRSRFRPIFVSVSTTIIGMALLLFETSTQAQTLKPLVIAVVFGLMASIVLVIAVLPAFNAALEDLRRKASGQRSFPT